MPGISTTLLGARRARHGRHLVLDLAGDPSGPRRTAFIFDTELKARMLRAIRSGQARAGTRLHLVPREIEQLDDRLYIEATSLEIEGEDCFSMA